jgi:hypothetical protein
VDLDALALDQGDVVVPTDSPGKSGDVPCLRKGEFLAGPLSWPLLDKAASLPGKALHVWLILRHKARLSRRQEVSVCLRRIGHGLNEWATSRALRRLEAAGLVTIHRLPGHALQVRVSDLLTDPPGEARTDAESS